MHLHFPSLFCFGLVISAAPLFAKTGDSLSPEDRQRLEKDKVLIGNREYRQSFSPYIGNDVPVFITSDALLNAFHVIFEESLARMESAMAPRLEALLGRMEAHLPKAVAELMGADEWKAGAAKRAEILLKTALRLLGKGAAGSTKEIEQGIAAQVKEIEAATGQRKPEWLGPPDAGFLALDFTRYAPRGFYDRTDRLKRYFRAVSWLQSVPFRVLKEEEFLAARLLGRAAHLGQPAMAWQYVQREPFLEAWNGMAGSADADLLHLLHDCRNPLDYTQWDSIAQLCQRKAEDFRRRQPQVNDTLRFPLEDSRNGQDPEYRMLAARELPDAIMLQRSSLAGGDETQRYPDTLEVAAGLGSKFAEMALAEKLGAEMWGKVAPSVRWLSKRLAEDSLYESYLDLLGEVVNDPEPDAPDFMRGEGWQRKSCGTLLASWAQMRHALVLQAKTHQFFAGLDEVPPGFVEPDPEFFRLLGELTVRCIVFFSENGAFDDNTEAAILDELSRARDQADKMSQFGASDSFQEDYPLSRAWRRIGDSFPLPDEPDYPEREDGMTDEQWEKAEKAHETKMKAYYGRLRAAFDELMQKIQKAPAEARAAMLAKLRLMETQSIASRWRGLADLCSQACSIAHRQLRKAPLTEQQNAWIRNFGFALAGAMFYDGNSYQAARDDAPRVVDIFSGPQGHLHAAIGRPRILYVLYPWDGKEVLCVGSVLPYHDFLHGPDRLTDADWLKQLDATPPPPAAWIAPIMESPAKADREEKKE